MRCRRLGRHDPRAWRTSWPSASAAKAGARCSQRRLASRPRPADSDARGRAEERLRRRSATEIEVEGQNAFFQWAFGSARSTRRRLPSGLERTADQVLKFALEFNGLTLENLKGHLFKAVGRGQRGPGDWGYTRRSAPVLESRSPDALSDFLKNGLPGLPATLISRRSGTEFISDAFGQLAEGACRRWGPSSRPSSCRAWGRPCRSLETVRWMNWMQGNSSSRASSTS